MWFEKGVFYHIYPLGFCGAPNDNTGENVNRIRKVEEWIPHLKELEIDCVYFGPVFESDRHGYDTRDYTKIDGRLGSNEDFVQVCKKLHDVGIKVMLDGVFNHVGRGFWAFQDVLKNREASPYVNWFSIDFSGNSNYNDGLWYEGWEGHYELVKLNFQNNDVVEYLLNCVRKWIEEFKIDGIRLDVAYMLDREFMKKLKQLVKGIDPEFFLLGEIIHGDYNQIVNPEMLDSCTNYECYKGLYSSFNDMNMFEIAYSLNRMFGAENYTLYKGKHLAIFADNHDVNRLGSTIKRQEHLAALYGLLFTMPGIPFIYYGSEWGATGEKINGDDSGMRACYDGPISNELTKTIALLSGLHTSQPALIYGTYRQVHLTNEQFVFEREYQGEKIVIAMNLSDQERTVFTGINSSAENLITGGTEMLQNNIALKGFDFAIWKIVQ